jgi:HlyD family secretion protein
MLKLLAPPMKTLARSAKDLKRRASDSSQWLMSFSPAPVLEDAIPFQDPIDEICAERPPRLMGSTHYIIVALFLTLLLVASLVKVDIVIVGTGRLTTATPPIVLQPIERGIIRELNVKEGDVVKKGQVLATLDPTFARADLSSLSAQQRSLVAQIRRLDAELNDKPFVLSAAPTQEELLQQSLYDQRHAQYDSQLRVFDEEIERRKANIRTTEADRSSQAQQLELARQIEAMRAAMLEKQVGSKLNFVEAQSARMRIEQSYTEAGNHLVELQHDLQSKQAERQSFVNDWRNKTLESLVSARNESTRVGDGLSKASLINDLVVVTAPQDGVVLDVANRSVGSIMREAEPLITLVQSNAALVGEIMINSSDIGYTHPGDEVVVKVDAFPYQIHGTLKGKLVSVSEESFGSATPDPETQTGLSSIARTKSGAFHRGLVQLTSTTLDSLPAGSRLIPGMTMAAEIKVGSRSIISYFLYPLTRGLSESIREP